MKQPKAIIFDLGGVIIDVDFDRVFEAWASMSGVSASSLKTHFATDTDYQRHERGEIDAAGFFECQRRRLAIDLTDAQFLQGWNAIFGPKVEGIDELIRRACKLAPCYVFSNTNAAHQTFWEAALTDTLPLFEKVYVSNQLGLRKPQAAAFRQVCTDIGAAPADVLFFDDTRENLDGAEAVGITAVRVDGPDDVHQTLVALGA